MTYLIDIMAKSLRLTMYFYADLATMFCATALIISIK